MVVVAAEGISWTVVMLSARTQDIRKMICYTETLIDCANANALTSGNSLGCRSLPPLVRFGVVCSRTVERGTGPRAGRDGGLVLSQGGCTSLFLCHKGLDKFPDSSFCGASALAAKQTFGSQLA